MMATEEII